MWTGTAALPPLPPAAAAAAALASGGATSSSLCTAPAPPPPAARPLSSSEDDPPPSIGFSASTASRPRRLREQLSHSAARAARTRAPAAAGMRYARGAATHEQRGARDTNVRAHTAPRDVLVAADHDRRLSTAAGAAVDEVDNVVHDDGRTARNSGGGQKRDRPHELPHCARRTTTCLPPRCGHDGRVRGERSATTTTTSATRGARGATVRHAQWRQLQANFRLR